MQNQRYNSYFNKKVHIVGEGSCVLLYCVSGLCGAVMYEVVVAWLFSNLLANLSPVRSWSSWASLSGISHELYTNINTTRYAIGEWGHQDVDTFFISSLPVVISPLREDLICFYNIGLSGRPSLTFVSACTVVIQFVSSSKKKRSLDMDKNEQNSLWSCKNSLKPQAKI